MNLLIEHPRQDDLRLALRQFAGLHITGRILTPDPARRAGWPWPIRIGHAEVVAGPRNTAYGFIPSGDHFVLEGLAIELLWLLDHPESTPRNPVEFQLPDGDYIHITGQAPIKPAPTPKEPTVAADIETKTFTRKRIEWWVPTYKHGVEGARIEDMFLARAWAQQALVAHNQVKEGESTEGRIQVKPSDEHVIVFIEFDEEQG